ncbi:hypothetical protein TBLA_0D00340 [Henningerozyma blattae CBS 6284]|uniref:FAM192A/Fyv6 N-terminal domain-containing protein n=1 Tax=Henningerozyma blattae (strain ATCC 34711 / CBS 6284 / DSM 70876 / NBRC 10599 / NRRL Y-10934 / UCD 77-7) TaxID=1071380 RepID=I2H2E2_HENB6|nr:hypothetical protein TBLA_0D00340 [Tetrapisispora blattae CBS 6284]CCH60544.1 hypothetical protein TBLA_0D00340 [Tetrapisispora blattae CBS 6284]
MKKINQKASEQSLTTISINGTQQTSGIRGKKPLVFVSEGVTNLEEQKEKAHIQQERYESEARRRERKTLRDQLRNSTIKKQKEFTRNIRDREGFNRLSKKEIDYYNNIESAKIKQKNDLEKYLSNKGQEFDRRKELLAKNALSSEGNPGINRQDKNILSPVIGTKIKDKEKLRISGIVSKNNKIKKLKIKITNPT